jgi:hypothetical protein
MKNSEYSENAHLLILLIASYTLFQSSTSSKPITRFMTELMSTEHDEQPTELTYPTTIRLVLASDDSDKENHIPNIRRDEIAVKLEQPTTESLGGNSIEGTGGSTAIDHSDPLRQDLPRSVTPDTGTNGAETTRTMASIPDVLRNEIDRQPLRPIPLRQTQTCNQSFSNLRSGQEIHDRIITSPHLQDSLSHMTISTDSPDSGASSKTTDLPSPSPNEPEDSSTGNAPI